MAGDKKTEVVLSVDHVSKNFALPHEKNSSIKSGIVNVFKKRDKSVEVQHALKDVSFEIKKGEFFGILGRNGSGKSTLLKILAEIYRPTTGSVKTKGKLVPFIELGVGFNPELTGRENVYLNGALLGFSRREIDARYDDIVAFAELEDFMDQKLKNYSSGMQVRLAFSVATRAEADILLVDEVLAVGDADFQRKCYEFFKSLKKDKKTVVFVSHDMGAVKEYCDRAVLISNGNVVVDDAADIVANEYLKLFNEAEYDADGDASQNGRWGNKHVTFSSIDAAIKNGRLTIDMKVVNNGESTEGLNIGVDIFDSEGQLVCGTELMRDMTKGFALKAGQKSVVKLESDNIFGGGTYSVTASIRLNHGTVVCDFWNRAAVFSNNTEENRYFPVILPATISIQNER